MIHHKSYFFKQVAIDQINSDLFLQQVLLITFKYYLTNFSNHS
jgi:hypothetical protein